MTGVDPKGGYAETQTVDSQTLMSWCKRKLVTVGPVMINCDPGGSQSQVSRPSEPEWGQGGRLILLSERLQAAGGGWRRWWWHWQYSAHLPLPVSAHDCGAYNNPLIFANVLWLMVLAGVPSQYCYHFERTRIYVLMYYSETQITISRQLRESKKGVCRLDDWTNHR